MIKNKVLAGLLSLIFPGLGHLYAGRYTDGMVYLLAAGVLWAAVVLKGAYLFEMEPLRTLIFWGGFAGVYLYALADVIRKVKQS